MDIATMSLLIGILITMVAALIGGFFAGFTGALILGSLAMLSLAFIPATPIIPIWLAVFIVTIEIILTAYKIATSFGLGRTQGD